VDIAPGTPFGIILDKTCLYAEAGGQEYDTGSISFDIDKEGDAKFEVIDCQSFKGYVVHIGVLEEGQIIVGDAVIATYDQDRRRPLRSNHTATHILNHALRSVLDPEMDKGLDQKGSLVAPTKLRFDFSHKSPVKCEGADSEMQRIEEICLQWIKDDVPVYGQDLPLSTARKIPGLRAVFGETYPDPVRVVTLKYKLDNLDVENPKWKETSVEFCGGT
jgi:alanyl-tRNA synthetase